MMLSPGSESIYPSIQFANTCVQSESPSSTHASTHYSLLSLLPVCKREIDWASNSHSNFLPVCNLQSNRNKTCERCFLCRLLEFCKYCHKCRTCCHKSTCRGKATAVLGEVGRSGFKSKSSHNAERGLHPPLPVQTQSNQVTMSHPRPAERDSRQAIQTWPDHSNRMVPSHKSVSSPILPVASASSGLVCTVCVTGPRPPGLGSGCTQPVLGKSGPI